MLLICDVVGAAVRWLRLRCSANIKHPRPPRDSRVRGGLHNAAYRWYFARAGREPGLTAGNGARTAGDFGDAGSAPSSWMRALARRGPVRTDGLLQRGEAGVADATGEAGLNAVRP